MLDNLPRGTICIEDIEMGMSRYLQKQVTDEDIELFAKVSTDHNPVHLDEDYAQPPSAPVTWSMPKSP